MPLFSFEGACPVVHETAWIAPTATLIGNVTIEAGASVWYGAVIRADFGPVVIRANANVQDNSVIHVGTDGGEIGEGATVGHTCVVHGATVGARAVIGNGATIQDGATIGAGAMVAAGSVVAPGTEVPDGTLAVGAPARRFLPLSDGARWWVDNNTETYRTLARRHRDGAREVT